MAAVLDELKTLPLQQRINVIAADVKSGADIYRNASAHDIAELVGIQSSWHPDGEWTPRAAYLPRNTLAELTESTDCLWSEDVADKVKKIVSEERYKVMEEVDAFIQTNAFQSKKITLALERLSVEETALIENLHHVEWYESGQHYYEVAYISVSPQDGEPLVFEAEIEDDGTCITLLTPYDERDGAFTADDPNSIKMGEW